jgi:hypothetical protein
MSKKDKFVIQVDDLTQEYASGYSSSLTKSLKNRINSAVHAYEEDGDVKIAQTVYFGCRADKKYTTYMVKKLVDVMETLQEKGYVRGFLCGFSRITLVNDEYAVLIYPALTQEGVQFVEANFKKLTLRVGDTPVHLKEIE